MPAARPCFDATSSLPSLYVPPGLAVTLGNTLQGVDRRTNLDMEEVDGEKLVCRVLLGQRQADVSASSLK